jgi:4-amino-4-deoxy-L-arabinose transferase-like glycosyltransferase
VAFSEIGVPAAFQGVGRAIAPHMRLAALVVVLVAAPILFSARFLDEPLDRDEAAYLTVANEVLHGAVPYQDVFDHKPPLLYGWYVAPTALFDSNPVGVRLLGALVLAATALLVLDIGRTLFSRRVGVAASLSFGLSTGIAYLEPNVNSEPYMLFLATASLAALARSVRNSSFALAGVAGALCAGAVLTKTVAVWHFPVLVVGAASLAGETSFPRMRAIRVLLGGFGAVALAGVLPFLLAGALPELWYANVTYNRLYAADATWPDRLNALGVSGRALAIVAGPWLAGAAAGVAFALFRKRDVATLLIALWLAASVLGVASTGRFFPHYFVQLLVPLSLLCGFIPDAWSAWVRGRVARDAVGFLLLLLVAFTVLVDGAFYAPETAEERNYRKDGTEYSERANLIPEIAAYVRERTPPDERIFNFGRETQLYVYADRRPATRFMYDRPYWLDPDTFDATLADLRRRPPLYIVDTITDDALPTAPMRALLAELYERETTIEFATIYRRRAP